MPIYKPKCKQLGLFIKDTQFLQLWQLRNSKYEGMAIGHMADIEHMLQCCNAYCSKFRNGACSFLTKNVIVLAVFTVHV